MKTRIAAAVLLLAPAILWSQTATKKPTTATRPRTTGPTRVTGPGTKTASGLQYWDIKVGTGQEAKAGDHVKVHYTGSDKRKEIRQLRRREAVRISHR